MNKKNTLALYTLLAVGLFSLFTTNIFAQATDSLRTEQKTKTCSGEKFVMPQTISLGNEAFENYLKTASLSRDERRKTFSKLSNEQKASFIKVNLALQFIKRPNMTKEQQEFVLDAISKVSADIYDKSDAEKARLTEQNGREIENKALGLFAYKELGDFIEPLMTSKDEETALLQKYENLLKNGINARKKLVQEMPVNDRVNIWKVQLAYHLATGRFSKIQKEFILEMLTSLSPETFASRANLTKEEEAKATERLESGVFNVFSKEEGFAIFMAVGIQKMAVGIQKSVQDDPPIDLPPSWCNCNFYCEGDLVCDQPNGCMSTETGCGIYGTSGCHYKCK